MGRAVLAIFLLSFASLFAAADIRIGYIGGLSGPGSENASTALKALTLAVDAFNTEKSLGARRVQILTFDTKSSPAESLRAFEKAKKAGLSILIGVHNSNEGLVLSRLCEKAKLPLLVTSATHPAITLNRKYVVRVGFNDTAQASALTRFAVRELKAKRLAIVTDVSDSFSTSLSRELALAFRKKGGVTVLQHQMQTGEVDYSAFILAIQNMKKKPDLIFSGMNAIDSSNLMAQMAKADLSIPVIGNDSWQSNNLKAAITKLNETFVPAYYPTHWHPYLKNKESVKFLELFRRRYSDATQNLNSDAALTYDATLLFLQALKKAAINDPNTIMASIRRESVKGVTGNIEMHSGKDPEKSINIVQLHTDAKGVGVVR